MRHQRRGDLVGGEHVLVRARPVGQQRARDGGLRLRVLRARRAVISQQRVYGEQILGPTDVSLSNWTVRPSSGCSVVLATHTAGVSVDGYTLTLAANPWNIVRTYNLTPSRELLFACRYRLGTASNFVVYVSEADNVYDCDLRCQANWRFLDYYFLRFIYGFFTIRIYDFNTTPETKRKVVARESRGCKKSY